MKLQVSTHITATGTALPAVRTTNPVPMPSTQETFFDHIQAMVPAVSPCMHRYVSIRTGPRRTACTTHRVHLVFLSLLAYMQRHVAAVAG